MPGEDKTLAQTIADVTGESGSQSSSVAVETEKGLSEGQSAETQSGENADTVPEYIAGMKTAEYLKDVPEQDRPRILKFLKEKGALADKGIVKKFQEIEPLKKAMDDISSLGLTVDEARDAIVERAKRKKEPLSTEAKKTVKILDNLLELSPVEQREALRQLRQITHEEAEDAPSVKELRQQVAEISRVLGIISTSSLEVKKKEIYAELDGEFTKKLGKDFIEKHRDKIADVAMKNPGVPLSKIVKVETPDEEYEQALLSQKMGNRKPLTEEKRNAISSNGEGVTVGKETIKTDGKWNQFLRDLNKK